MSALGVAPMSSWASSRPPFAPRLRRALLTESVSAANGARSGNRRPNVVGAVATAPLRAATARGAPTAAPTPPAIATAPAPAPARFKNPRLL